jgi:hypothetical protein
MQPNRFSINPYGHEVDCQQDLEFVARKSCSSLLGDVSPNAKNSHLRLWASLYICERAANNARNMSLHELQAPDG